MGSSWWSLAAASKALTMVARMPKHLGRGHPDGVLWTDLSSVPTGRVLFLCIVIL